MSTIQPRLAIYPEMIEHNSNVATILHQIRLSRMKLGSILDRLENFEPGPDAIDDLQDHANAISIEIQLFIETLQIMMGD